MKTRYYNKLNNIIVTISVDSEEFNSSFGEFSTNVPEILRSTLLSESSLKDQIGTHKPANINAKSKTQAVLNLRSKCFYHAVGRAQKQKTC